MTTTHYYIVDGRRQYGTADGQDRQQQPPSVPNRTKPNGAPAGGQQQQQQQPPDEGSSSGGVRAPPTYAEAIKGDNKIQTQD